MSHLGYEFLPRWLVRVPILRWINTATFHSLHHTKLKGNFGLRTLLADGGDGETGSIAAELIRRHGGSGAHEVLRRAIERGELPPDTDVRLLLSVIAGTLMHRILIERGRVTQRELERLVDLVLYGASGR